MDCSPSESSVHGISQAKILEWVAISFSRSSLWTLLNSTDNIVVELPASILLLRKDKQKSGLWHRGEQPEKSSKPWVWTSLGLHLLKLQLWLCVIFTNRDEWNFEILTDALSFPHIPSYPHLSLNPAAEDMYMCMPICVCVCVCVHTHALRVGLPLTEMQRGRKEMLTFKMDFWN